MPASSGRSSATPSSRASTQPTTSTSPGAHQHLTDGREREIGREAPPPLRVRGDDVLQGQERERRERDEQQRTRHQVDADRVVHGRPS